MQLAKFYCKAQLKCLAKDPNSKPFLERLSEIGELTQPALPEVKGGVDVYIPTFSLRNEGHGGEVATAISSDTFVCQNLITS
jgi:hypothetical protein